jgi:hypothetical protein
MAGQSRSKDSVTLRARVPAIGGTDRRTPLIVLKNATLDRGPVAGIRSADAIYGAQHPKIGAAPKPKKRHEAEVSRTSRLDEVERIANADQDSLPVRNFHDQVEFGEAIGWH